jgi:hypothetical protein
MAPIVDVITGDEATPVIDGLHLVEEKVSQAVGYESAVIELLSHGPVAEEETMIWAPMSAAMWKYSTASRWGPDHPRFPTVP